MEGNKTFPYDILRDKIDHQGFTVVYRVWILHPMGGRGMHDIKGGKCGHSSTYRLYVLEMLP